MTYHKSRAKIAILYGLAKGFNLFYLICPCKLHLACGHYGIYKKRDRTDDVMKTPLGICFRGFPLL